MRGALPVHDEILPERSAARGGRVLNTEGDAFVVEFADPAAAIAWCTEVRDLRSGAPTSARASVRADLGDVAGAAAGLAEAREIAASMGAGATSDLGVMIAEVASHIDARLH
jgi:class 3 adenylate cyclase